MSLKNSLAFIPLAFIFSIGKLYDERLDFFDLPVSEIFFGLYILTLIVFIGRNGLRMFKDKETIGYFIMLLAILFFGLVGDMKNGLNENYDYSLDKASVLVLVILLPSFIIRSFKKEDIDRFLRIIFFVSVFLFLGGLVALAKGGGGGGDEEHSRLSVLGGGPIVFARWISYCILYALVFPFSNKIRAVILAVGMVLILFSGSRGPLFTLIPILILFYIIKYGFKKSVIILSILGIGFVAGIQYFADNSALIRVMGGDESSSLVSGSSSQSRQMKYIESATIFSENPFGIGLGNYARYAPSADHVTDYPHNFVVEMFVEEGIVAGFLGLCFILLLFGRIFRSGKMVKDKTYLFLMLITLYTFMNSLVSGDLGDLRFFLTYSLLLITVYQIHRSARRKQVHAAFSNEETIYPFTELSY